MAQAVLKTYRGNCHCGAFIFEIQSPEIKTYAECNCSICTKKGYSWIFPGDDRFSIVKGSLDDLKEYTFGTGKYHHKFCPRCGTAVMCSDSQLPRGKQVAVNGRAIQNLNVWDLGITPFDDKSMGDPYPCDLFTYDGPEPPAEIDDAKIYHGSCHCGNVQVAVKTKPLETYKNGDDNKVVECNCSICRRGGYIWIYPKKEQVALKGAEHLTKYTFNFGILQKAFCSNCGVHVMSEPVPLTEDEVKALPEVASSWYRRAFDIRPINIRILNDFDCTTLKPLRLDGWNLVKPEYVNP